jgi:tetratricopeptide (TPR) repeat protein
MERRASQESVVDLIDSGQFLAAEEIFAERRTNDPMEMVIRAEVAMYFNKLGDAASLLAEVGPRVDEIDVAARFSLSKGRVALWHGDEQSAETQLQTAYHFYSFLNDSFGVSKSLLYLAQLARRQDRLDEAGQKLDAAQSGIKGRTSRRTEYLRGLIATELAALAIDTGEIDKAGELFTEATRLLKNAEKGRFYARALTGMASFKCALGEFQDSLELYKEANIVFERYDIRKDLAISQLELAKALMRLKRFERAEKLAEDSREVSKGDPVGESRAIATLALTALNQNVIDQAGERALQAVALADQIAEGEGIEQARACARIALGYVSIARHEFKDAVEALQKASEIAHSLTGSANRRIELESAICLAEAYHSLDTRAGRAELQRASELLNSIEDAWLGDEFNRVSAKYEEQIVFTDDNRLVFDGNQLPRWQEAKRTLEGFLLRNALRQTNNSLTRAARKLGVSKVHVHNLKKKHNI